MMDIENEIKKLIDASEDGYEALNDCFEEITARVVESTKRNLEPGTSLREFCNEVRKAEDFIETIAKEVLPHRIAIKTEVVQMRVREQLTKHRQTSPFEPNWTPRGRAQ